MLFKVSAAAESLSVAIANWVEDLSAITAESFLIHALEMAAIHTPSKSVHTGPLR